MGKGLLQQLEQYSRSDYYPFHMPGHKRNAQIDFLPAEIDITEIDGFDNLHHAVGVLAEAQSRAAQLFGAEESFLLINGSTCGILSAISASVPFGGRILLARNSHKAAYHGVFLRGLDAVYVYPEQIGGYGICGGVMPESVSRCLEREKDIQAVFITSPTYEGMVSNIEEIADITHKSGAILIVDEAHGAHFHVGGATFPASAVSCGADIVIQSLHKTLPSMTQTAILHVQGKRVNKAGLRRYLQMYQSSSPSYVMMAGMDSCVRWLEKCGEQMFGAFSERLRVFYERMAVLRHLHVLMPGQVRGKFGVKEMDASKICIFVERDGRSVRNGKWLYQELLERYHLQLEMAAGDYVLAMTSVLDTEEGFQRLERALLSIDDRLERELCKISGAGLLTSSKSDREVLYRTEGAKLALPVAQVAKRSLEMERQEGHVLYRLEDAIGMISMEYRYAYPPGVPVLVPGEVITPEVVSLLRSYEEQGLEVLGGEGEGIVVADGCIIQ